MRVLVEAYNEMTGRFVKHEVDSVSIGDEVGVRCKCGWEAMGRTLETALEALKSAVQCDDKPGCGDEG